jgi:hypothetical protein
MQRRAAAVYLVLFVVLAGGAYAYIEVGATQPQISIDGPTYEQGDTLSVDGRTYTVTGLSAESGESGISRSGELTWFNESNMETAELENDSTIEFRDDQYTVSIANGSNISSFRVTESQNVSAIIANDSNVTGIVQDDDSNERFVRYTNGSTQLLSEYLPPVETVNFSTGETFPYTQENSTIDTTVASVSSSAATLEWNNPANETVGLEDGGNVTLNGQTYFAHFESNSSVQILPAGQYYGEYQSDQADIQAYDERINGLWGIVLLSLVATIILVAAAYLPNKS